MEETPKENIIESGCEIEHDEENSFSGNDKQSNDGHGTMTMRMTQIHLKIHFSLEKSIPQLIF